MQLTPVIGIALVLGTILILRSRRHKSQASANLHRDEAQQGASLVLQGHSGLSLSEIPLGTRTVEVSRVHKSFGGKEVVSDVSFEVRSGEILGMVGPNGAGKTTTIRMLMDIIKADSGEIRVLGQPPGKDAKERIGYLPEERGLYRKITVSQALDYLAQLKGMPSHDAKVKRDELLQRIGMFPHRDKKMEQLSRGMSQLIQFAATILHDPEMVVLDEPFSGLDPVNKEVLKDLVLEFRNNGKTVILSTHMMSEVEELCDRVLMINQGKVVLNGPVSKVRSGFRNNSVLVECEGSLEGLTGIRETRPRGIHTELFLDEHTSPQDVLSQLLDQGVTVHRFEVSTPSLHDIFLKVVKGS